MRWVWLLLALLLFNTARAEWDPFARQDMQIEYKDPYVTIQAEDVKLADVLTGFAQAVDLNLIIPANLDASANVYIQRLHWKDALSALLSAHDLEAIYRGDVISLVHRSKQTQLAMRRYALNHARAVDLVEALRGQKGLLSQEGSVGLDTRANAFIVHDTERVLKQVDEWVVFMDAKQPQVLIQANIMNANQSFSQALGLNFSTSPNAPLASEGFGHFNITLATLPHDVMLNVALSASEKNHQTEVIAKPKLLTANHKEAVIKQGKELAYEETSASGATSLRFKEAVMELAVTPHISDDQHVILDLKVKHDVLGSLADNGQPTIDTQYIETQVSLQDQETVVLGGIYASTALSRHARLPFLARIPLIGLLFQDKNARDEKHELLIFVTPHILI